MTERHYLPPLLNEIAEVAGLPAALKLCEDYGGREVYIPAKVGASHWLAQCVGLEAARAIVEHFSAHVENELEESRHGARIMVPMGSRNFHAKARKRAAELLREGVSHSKTAEAVGVHTRTIERVAARERDLNKDFDGKQGRLF